MVSSPDQTQQAPFMFFLIIHYFERPASSVRLVKSIYLRACHNIGLSMNSNDVWLMGKRAPHSKTWVCLQKAAYVLFNNNSKDSPTSIGGEMNCYWKINGSGGRREIGIPHWHEASHSRLCAAMSDSVKLPTVDWNKRKKETKNIANAYYDTKSIKW